MSKMYAVNSKIHISVLPWSLFRGEFILLHQHQLDDTDRKTGRQTTNACTL